jgi:ATP-dependent DNA helicase DinG
LINLDHFFSTEGALSQKVPDYELRVEQFEMATAIYQAIENEKHLVAEAGTGTGKTFAYLAAVIAAGKKAVISTGTKNLQDQLFFKDIAMLRQVIETPFSACLLKGRSNYLCLYRLEKALHSHSFNAEEQAQLMAIKDWSLQTKSGDITQMEIISESAPVWFQATSTADNCLGQECPDYHRCHLTQARKMAKEADITVVNHHLLCADWSIRDTGFGELLPDADVIVIDEAHQLAKVASGFLGNTVSGNQIKDLAQSTIAESVNLSVSLPNLRRCAEEVLSAVITLKMAFGIELKRGAWVDLEVDQRLWTTLKELLTVLNNLSTQLSELAGSSKGIDLCSKRSEQLIGDLETLVQAQDSSWIQWYEVFKKTFTLSRTPVNIANDFQSFMRQHGQTWVFTSATLSVGKKFDYFLSSLGLEGVDSHYWESPFDYPGQSLFYHPKGVSLPNSTDFIDSIVKYAQPVIVASQGRAFFLFTSHATMRAVAKQMEAAIEFPLLVQGTRSKSYLLQRFKQSGNAVLLGTSSFWEGVDVRGEALSCVIIDKLPFEAPNDPVLKARLKVMEQSGDNPFSKHQLPEAVISLRQGVGRLIRDSQDRGVLMICDPRLLKRSYGRVFLDSLPNMARTREIEDVREFFRQG